MEQQALLLNVQEASEILRINKVTLYGLIKKNAIKHVKIGKRRLLRHEDIDQFIQDNLSK